MAPPKTLVGRVGVKWGVCVQVVVAVPADPVQQQHNITNDTCVVTFVGKQRLLSDCGF